MYQVEAPEHGMTVSWGVNRWVLVEAPGGTLQRQVSSAAQLAALLMEMGVDRAGAEELAQRCWHERPHDAGLPAVRRREAVWKSTGLSAGRVAVLLAVVVALVVAFWLLRL